MRTMRCEYVIIRDHQINVDVEIYRINHGWAQLVWKSPWNVNHANFIRKKDGSHFCFLNLLIAFIIVLYFLNMSSSLKC